MKEWLILGAIVFGLWLFFGYILTQKYWVKIQILHTSYIEEDMRQPKLKRFLLSLFWFLTYLFPPSFLKKRWKGRMVRRMSVSHHHARA